MPLTAPFPWYGAKRRWAESVWERFGNDLGAYVEPFAGSLAVLLHRPTPVPREVVCDTDGALCNFWRAIRAAPDEVAYWCDYPTIHQDLTARHRWLIQWAKEHAEQLSEDPEYYDARAAGWWVWGISLWIGTGWCLPTSANNTAKPRTKDTGGGQGVARRPYGTMPVVQTWPGARGVSAQGNVREQMPRTGDQYSGSHVTAQRVSTKTRPDLIEWFGLIAARLKGTIVLNRGWESAVTPTVLMQTASGPKPPVGILMDPPYLTDERSKHLYSSDILGESNRVARESYEWAIAHGRCYRIAYCCHAGDFEVPDGWTFETQTFGGIKNAERFANRRDMIMFSPACIPGRQARLW